MSLVNIKRSNDISTLYFVFYGATNFEKKGIYGISHLMEHLVCKKFDDLSEDFEADCIDFNAQTEDDTIIFHFTGLEECLAKYRNKIIKRMYNPFKVTKKMLQDEKAIVQQELDEVFKDIGSLHYLLFFRRHYNHFSSVGSSQDIERITVEECNEFYKKQFAKPDKIISSSKDFVLTLDPKYTFENRVKKRRKLKLMKNINNSEIELYNKGFGSDIKNIFMVKEIDPEDFPVSKIVTRLFHSGSLSSPLINEVREKRSLVYGIDMSSTKMCGNAFVMISTTTHAKNKDAVLQTIDMVLKDYKTHITPERLERTVRSLKIQRKLIDADGAPMDDDDLAETEKKYRRKLDNVTFDETIAFCEKYINGNDQFTCIDVF